MMGITNLKPLPRLSRYRCPHFLKDLKIDVNDAFYQKRLNIGKD